METADIYYNLGLLILMFVVDFGAYFIPDFMPK